MINYNNRKFRPIINSDNGEVDNETVFHYRQIGNILSCDYQGKLIQKGHLIGLVDELGNISLRYKSM